MPTSLQISFCLRSESGTQNQNEKSRLNSKRKEKKMKEENEHRQDIRLAYQFTKQL